jgi:putative membrane protein
MNYVKSTLLMFAALVAWWAGPMLAQSGHDPSFVTKAAAGGMAEVQMAQLAQSKAQSQAVKDLATRLNNDHSKANDELKMIAGKANMSLPGAPTIKQQREYNKLQALSGAAFDREYVNYQIKDHKEDIEMFQREADHGMNPEVKAFAAKHLPALREHLRLAEDALK